MIKHRHQKLSMDILDCLCDPFILAWTIQILHLEHPLRAPEVFEIKQELASHAD